MRRWLPPLILGLVLAIVVYNLAMVQIPRTLMSFATGRISKLAGYNAMAATPLATDKARAIVRPSPDLAYSSCPYDVSNGPVLVDIEPVPSRYWSLSVFDARTDVKFVRNNIDAEGRPIRIAIALAGQPVPDGMQAVRVDGATGIALLRILVEDGAQFPAIDAARKKSSCKPLS
ncbi:DUF1254 domain-containing protein [Sphingomonas bacterium]|uniref:DUF1254 domain-containing protein n=1 Tax=Sphingomonas bacterium TaxID=1895847 RepID=UPI00261596F4|nr:DUF1254 domain-containing protein [Sphingomonas bacterium]MDB5679818.1 hypothetical protein [Sphingomonas bacterium]